MSILSLPQKNIHTGNLILVNAAHGYHAPERFDLAGAPMRSSSASGMILWRRAGRNSPAPSWQFPDTASMRPDLPSTWV